MVRQRVILERRFVLKGSVIMEEGEDAYSAYLIQSGRVSVYSEHDGTEHEFAQLGVGDICGEMALIDEGPRSASVKAIEDCNIIVITRTAFENKLANSDATVRAIVRMLMERVRRSNAELLDKVEPLTLDSLPGAVGNLASTFAQDLDDEGARADFERDVQEKLEALMQLFEK